MKTHIKTLIGGLAALALAGCGHKTAAPGPGSSPGVTVLRVGYISTNGSAISGPEGWGQSHQLILPALKPLGVSEIQYRSFPNGPDLNEALAGGALDVGIYGDTPAIVGHAAGLRDRLINQAQVGMNAWLLTRKDGPKTLDALRGQTVGVAKGSYMSRYLLGLLQEKGLAGSVKVVHLMTPDAEPALQRGDIAAYAAPVGNGPILIAHGFAILDEARRHPDLRGSSVTVVTDAYLASHPDFPRLWNSARTASIQDAAAHTDAYYQFLSQATRLPVPVLRASYPLSQAPPQAFTPEGLRLLDGTKAFLLGQRLAKADFPLTDWQAGENARTASASLTKGASR